MTNPISVGFDIELHEVESAADALSRSLADTNLVPNDFPVQSVHKLCDVLTRIRSGSTEVAVEILVYARDKLPSWRKEFLANEEQYGHDYDVSSPPNFERQGAIDGRIKDLFSSVGTALSHYQLEHPDKQFSEIVREEPIKRDSEGDLGISLIHSEARQGEHEIEEGRASIWKHSSPSHPEEKAMDRSFVDSASRLQAVQVETGLSNPRPSHLAKFSDSISDSLQMLREVLYNLDKVGTPIVKAAGELIEVEVQGWVSRLVIIVKAIDNTVAAVSELRSSHVDGVDVNLNRHVENARLDCIISLEFSASRVSTFESDEVFKLAKKVVRNLFADFGIPATHVKPTISFRSGNDFDLRIGIDGRMIWSGHFTRPIREAFPHSELRQVLFEHAADLYSNSHTLFLIESSTDAAEELELGPQNISLITEVCKRLLRSGKAIVEFDKIKNAALLIQDIESTTVVQELGKQLESVPQ